MTNNSNNSSSNNSNSGNDDERDSGDEGGESEPKVSKWKDIADTYFRRNRIDELLAHAREAKTFGKFQISSLFNFNFTKKFQ